jgi:hypothetical protein
MNYWWQFTTSVFLVWSVLAADTSARSAGLQTAIAGPAAILSIHPVQQSGLLYGRSRDQAEWHVSQWNNPSGNLPDFQNGSTSNNSLAVIIRSAPIGSVTIAQNGKMLACTTAKGTPIEFDGLIGTNTSKNNQRLPSAERAISDKVSLASYTALVQEINLNILAASILSAPPRCPVSKAVAIVSVVLSNQTIQSTLFLQIILGSVNTSPRAVWWARGKPNGRFGYNFPAEQGTESTRIGEERQFRIDLLSMLRNLIENNNVGMDPDLRHWVISGAYFGNAIYGDVKFVTTWSGYQLRLGRVSGSG